MAENPQSPPAEPSPPTVPTPETQPTPTPAPEAPAETVEPAPTETAATEAQPTQAAALPLPAPTEAPFASERTKDANPLATKLRVEAKEIERLLEEYNNLRYGDKTFRYGDPVWRQGNDLWNRGDRRKGIKPFTKGIPPQTTVYACLNAQCSRRFAVFPGQVLQGCPKCQGTAVQPLTGFPPGASGAPPQISAISSPQNIYQEDTGPDSGPAESENEDLPEEKPQQSLSIVGQTVEETPKTEEREPLRNPLDHALMLLGEITDEEVKRTELDAKYNLLNELGVVERLSCSVLIPWSRQLASHLTYIFEMRLTYSTDIKALYPEMLNDLENARGTCDQLSTTLGKQGGVLTSQQYRELITKLLHYSEIAKSAAFQLADQHEDYMGQTGLGGPLENEAERKWVFQKPNEVENETPISAEDTERVEIDNDMTK